MDWTILRDWQSKNESAKKFTGLSNNPVENWFGQLKNHYFRNSRVMPSEYSSIMFKYLENQNFIYYEDEQSTLPHWCTVKQYLDELKKELKTQKIKNVNEIKEKWKNKVVRNGIKSFYYSSTDNFGYLNDLEPVDYKEDESDFFEAFQERKQLF